MIRILHVDQIPGILGDLRLLNRLTTRQLAEDAVANQGQISTWLNGDRTPNIASLIRLATALGYDLAFVPRPDAPPMTMPGQPGCGWCFVVEGPCAVHRPFALSHDDAQEDA